MTIFYVIFVLLTAYYSLRYDGIEEYDSHKQHRLWLMCLYLICLTGFSYGLGADKFTYMEEFEEYPNDISEVGDYVLVGFMVRGQMPFWTIVNVLCKILFNSFYAVQLLESIAINTAVCYVVSKYTKRYFLFLLIYFLSLQYFIFNTEVMREGFALAFSLIGMHGWLSGRKWLFFVMLPIAVMFHLSACAAILFPFMFFRISWKTLLYAFVSSFFLWAASDLLLGKLMLTVFGGSEAMVSKVLYYSIQSTSIFGFVRHSAHYLIFPFVVMYSSIALEPSESLKESKEKFTAYMVVLAIFAGAIPGTVRFFNYAYVFYFISLADFVYTLFRAKRHLLLRLGTMAGTIFFVWDLYTGHYKTTNSYFYEFFYPYTCILDEGVNVDFRPIAHQEATTLEVDEKKMRTIE